MSSSGRFNDSDILGPQPYPRTMQGKEAHVYQLEGLTFRADFDSANLKSVVSLKEASKEFQLHTLHDCDGTEYETAHRSWFYFSVSGHKAGDHLIFNVMNLNKQAKLFQNDFRPVFRTFGSVDGGGWERVRFPCSYQTVDGDFQLRFRHKFESAEETFFAYAYPNSYEEVQAMLWRVDDIMSEACSEERVEGLGTGEAAGPPRSEPSFSGPADAGPSPSGRSAAEQQRREERAARREEERAVFRRAKESIYYRRQLLGLSLEGRRVDLLTITDRGNVGDSAEEEAELPPDCFPSALEDPCHAFPGKKVVFVSSRVHPGETPGSHLFNGLLAFLLRPTDQRAVALRRMFVFKLVPLLNPDGVANGNYRCDTLGKNLNRFYLCTTKAEHPSIHCVSQLLQHYHRLRKLEFYMDLHAHANKRGVFAYGNALEGEEHIDTLTFCKLVSLNNPHFEFEACNFTERNMQLKDKNGDSKEGSGRVALFQQTGLVHIYTIEANYCCSRIMNQTSPASNVNDGRVSPPNRLRASPKYSPELLHGTGRALLIGMLDLYDGNPWSRLPESPYGTLEGVRNWVKACLATRQDLGCFDSDNGSNARDSPALPRGASFKKAGETIDECKAEKVFAEIERRRRASTMRRALSGNARPTMASSASDGVDAGRAREGRRFSSSGSAPAWNSPKARVAGVSNGKQAARVPLPRSTSARRQSKCSDSLTVEEAANSGGGVRRGQQPLPSAVSRMVGSKSATSGASKPHRASLPSTSDTSPNDDTARLQFKSVVPVSLDWHDPVPLANACQLSRTQHSGAFPIGKAIHEAASSVGKQQHPSPALASTSSNTTTLPMLSYHSSSSTPAAPMPSFADAQHHCSGRWPPTGTTSSLPHSGLMMTGTLKGKSVGKGEQGGMRQPPMMFHQQQHYRSPQQLQARVPAGGGHAARELGLRERAVFVPVEAE